MNEKKKILFAINDIEVGGAQNMVIEEANAIDAGRFEPHLLTLFPSSGNSLRKKLQLPDEQFHAFAFKSLFDLQSWRLLYAFMRAERFDAVVTNLFNANVIVRTVAILARVPVILTWEHNIYREKKRWQKAIDRLLARYTYRILVGAPQVKEFTVKQEHLPDQLVEVVYDAAELSFGEARLRRDEVLVREGLPVEAFYIVACGHLTEQKGHAYLIQAARILRDRRPAADIRFLIYGKGPLHDVLLAQIHAAGLDEIVHLKGVGDMRDILAMSDIFSLVSLWEGFSIALIQAMNAGCAVVASRVSGSVDAIENGVEGLLVPSADAEAAAAAFERLYEDAALRAALGKAASEKAKEFDIHSHVRRIERIIESGLQKA